MRRGSSATSTWTGRRTSLALAIRVTDASGMARWRKRLFAVGHNAADPVDYFGLPLERTIIMGSQIPL